VLLCALRCSALAHTHFATGSHGTSRLKLLKLGALVRISVCRLKVAFAPALHRHPRMAAARGRLAWARGSPPDTRRRPAPDRRHHPRPTGNQAPVTLTAAQSGATMAAGRSG
jgi:hypothetical protein